MSNAEAVELCEKITEAIQPFVEEMRCRLEAVGKHLRDLQTYLQENSHILSGSAPEWPCKVFDCFECIFSDCPDYGKPLNQRSLTVEECLARFGGEEPKRPPTLAECRDGVCGMSWEDCNRALGALGATVYVYGWVVEKGDLYRKQCFDVKDLRGALADLRFAEANGVKMEAKA